MDSNLTLRLAAVADAETIAGHRCSMFVEMGRMRESDRGPLLKVTVEYLEQALASGEYVGFLIEDGKRVIAGGGGYMRRVMPRITRDGRIFREAPQVLVMNMYTEPEYRRRGLATRILAAIEDWAQERDIPSVMLHASEAGRPMYEKLGYTPTNELAKYFDSKTYGVS